MELKTTPEKFAEMREFALFCHKERPGFLTMTEVTQDQLNLLDDFEALQTALHEARDDADAQRQLAENFSDAFGSKPDQQLADGLEEHVAMLRAELKSARAAMGEARDHLLDAWNGTTEAGDTLSNDERIQRCLEVLNILHRYFQDHPA